MRFLSGSRKDGAQTLNSRDIFKIQSILFEDFQVDRTELILTPKCLNIAVRRLDLISVMFQFRLMGDCTLEKTNHNCVKSLQNSIEKNLKEEQCSGTKFNINRIPGRLDFMIQLEKVDGHGYKPSDPFFDKMLAIFFGEHGIANIDRLQTTIGINEIPKEDSKHMATMQYRNFLAIIEYDPQIDSFHGRVINATPITFYGKSTEELKQEFARSVEEYFKFCQEKGIEPIRPYSV